MRDIVEVIVVSFDELSDAGKERARVWYRDGALDYPWYDDVFDDFQTVCEILGIRLATSSARLMGGGTRQKPNIYFSGF